MNDPFVNRKDAAFLQALSANEWEDFIARWGKGTQQEPVIFADGTMYGDCGREVERRVFWTLHKDDHTFCTKEAH